MIFFLNLGRNELKEDISLIKRKADMDVMSLEKCQSDFSEPFNRGESIVNITVNITINDKFQVSFNF